MHKNICTRCVFMITFFCISRQSCHRNSRIGIQYIYLTHTIFILGSLKSGLFSPVSSSIMFLLYVLLFVDPSKSGTKKPALKLRVLSGRPRMKTASFACLHPLSRELSPQTKLIFLLSSPFKKNPWHAEAHGCSHAQNLCTGFSPLKKETWFISKYFYSYLSSLQCTTILHPVMYSSFFNRKLSLF